MISLKDLLHVSLRQVFRQRRRSFGIILAIALGTAGLIAVLSVGDEVKKNLNRDLDLLGGATIIRVSFEDEKVPGVRPKFFSSEALEDLRNFPGIRLLGRSTKFILGIYFFHEDKMNYISVCGVDEGYWRANNLDAIQGRLFDADEMSGKAQVCLLGREVAQSLYGEGKALGKFVPIGKDLYRVVGVVDGLLAGQRRTFAFIPINIMQDRQGQKFKPDRLTIQCRTWDNVKPVAEAIPRIIARHQDPSFLKVEVQAEQLERILSIVWWVELFIYLAIGATLTLGGFGIWNGMMSSVTARTREIGLKKAMGAESLDIMGQFLCESLCLSLIASLLGVSAGYLIVEITSHYLGSAPSHRAIASFSGISIAFSGILGLVAGFYPALKASRMDAVTAIRYE